MWAIKNQWLCVSTAITVHTLRKKGEIKTVSVFTILPSSLIPWRSLNWQNFWGRENIFGVDCLDGCTQKEGGEKFAELYRNRVLVGIVRMILLASKGEIGKWKLTEEEELILGKDCSGGCIHKMGCENEGAPTIL